MALQRKDEDAALVKKNGILVPHIFETFEDAKQAVLKEKRTFIARSEHPTEQEGLSGLNISPTISLKYLESQGKTGRAFAKFKHADIRMFKTMAMLNALDTFCHYYCNWNDIDFYDYFSEMDYSFWEYIEGVNMYVTADPIVEGRIRIYCSWRDEDKGSTSSYYIFDGDVCSNRDEVPNFITENLEKIRTMYTQIQDMFGTEMCWVVEMQISVSGDLYFLQRSIGREKDNPSHTLGKEPSGMGYRVGSDGGYGEVIGSTGPEGITVDILHYRGTRLGWLEGEPLSNSAMSSHIISTVLEQEIIKGLDVYIHNRNYQGHGACISDPHSAIVPMTRAPLYLHMPNLHENFSDEIKEKIAKVSQEKEPDGRVRGAYKQWKYQVMLKLHIVSDGNVADVTIVDAH